MLWHYNFLVLGVCLCMIGRSQNMCLDIAALELVQVSLLVDVKHVAKSGSFAHLPLPTESSGIPARA